MKKAIVIGTSTGIGKALVYELHSRGYAVGVTGRNLDAMLSMQKELGGDIAVQVLDVRNSETAREALAQLIQKMGGLDAIIINAGILPINPNFEWDIEKSGTDVNVLGFQAMANTACHVFEKQKSGHLVGISSIASHRGTGRAPAYNASKAFVSIYMEGLRQRYFKTAIHITDIRPGFIDTPMTETLTYKFWSISAKQGARDIVDAMEAKRKVAYVPERWWWMAQIFKIIPEWLYHRLYRRYA